MFQHFEPKAHGKFGYKMIFFSIFGAIFRWNIQPFIFRWGQPLSNDPLPQSVEKGLSQKEIP